MDDKLKIPKQAPDEAWRNEPVQPKQRALLEFLKMPLPPTRGDASNQIKSVFEGLAGNAHQKAWEVAKYKLHPELYPSKSASAPSRARTSSPFAPVIYTVLVLGLGFCAWQWFHRDSDGSSFFEFPWSVKNPPAARRNPEILLIPLESTDGRTIKARILTLTKKTVLIRREDGQTFEIPLERLTPDSIQRIDEYRRPNARD